MDAEQPVAVLEELLAAKGEHLLRTAVLMTCSQDEGEDLLQAALERVFRKWRTVSGDPEGYLRRTMYHLAADGWRRQRAWRARVGLLAHPGTQPDATDDIDRRDHLVRLLRELPPRQRTAIVLRYWEELTEAETAQAMGCSPGTVKSATSRGLQKLREQLTAAGQAADTPQHTGRPS
jgi:RNA polymerase sigma-70 factor (sigma-E family)